MRRLVSMLAAVITMVLTFALFPTAAVAQPTEGDPPPDLSVQLALPEGYSVPPGHAVPNLEGVKGTLTSNDDPDLVWWALANEDGQLLFQDLEPGRYRLAVDDVAGSDLVGGSLLEGGQLGEPGTEQVIAIADQPVSVEARFVQGRALVGQVTDEQGRPVAGATIKENKFTKRIKATSGADGTFRAYYRPGTYQVWVQAPADSMFLSGVWCGDDELVPPVGWSWDVQEVIVNDEEIVPNRAQIKLRMGGAVAGTITNADGTPAVGAKVRLTDEYLLPPTVTDASGSYVLRGVDANARVHVTPGDAHHLAGYITPSGTVDADLWDATTVSPDPGTTIDGVDATLTAGGQVLGRITNLEAQLTGGASFYLAGSFQGHARIGADGTFSVGNLPAGTYQVNITLKDANTWESYFAGPVSVVVNPGEDTIIEVPASRGATATGRLLDASGAVVTSGAVIAEDNDGRFITSGEVGEDGTFTLRALAPGQFHLKHSLSFLNDIEGTYTAALNEDIALGDVRLATGHPLTIRVSDSMGTPVAGAEVSMTCSEDYDSATTGDDGLVTFDLVPDSGCTWMVSASGFIAAEGQVLAGAGEHLEVVLQRAVLTTVTVFANGRPLQYQKVEIRSTSEDGHRIEAWSDESGTLTVDLVAGEYRAYLLGRGEPEPSWSAIPTSEPFSVEGAQAERSVDFGALGHIIVHFEPVDFGEGGGFGERRVFLEKDGARNWYTHVGGDESYMIDNLPPGSYLVGFEQSDYSVYYDATFDPEEASPVTVTVGETQNVTLREPSWQDAIIRGTVTDEGGAPLAGVEIRVDEPETSRTLTTNAQGQFTTRIRSTGDVTVVAGVGFESIYEPKSWYQYVRAEEEYTADFVLTVGATLEGTIRGGTAADPTGAVHTETLAGARVILMSHPRRATTTNAEGVYVLRGLNEAMLASQLHVGVPDNDFWISGYFNTDNPDVVLELGGALTANLQLADGSQPGTVTYVLSPTGGGDALRFFAGPGSNHKVRRVPSGTYDITILHDVSATETVSATLAGVQVRAGEILDLGSITLNSTAQIDGHLSVSGVPLADARIRATVNGMPIASTLSDVNGAYTLAGMPVGPVHIEAFWGNQLIASAQVELADGDEAVVDLQADTSVITSLLRYRVETDETGAYRGNLALEDGGAPVHQLSGAQGQFVNLSGAFTLTMSGDPRYLDADVQADGRPVPPGEGEPIVITPGATYSEVVITPVRPATLTGTVRTVDGTAVPETPVSTGAQQTVTDDQGRYTITGLWPGDHVLVAHNDTGSGESAVAGLEAGQTRTVDITFIPHGVFTLTVTDPTGQVIEGARVALRSISGENIETHTDAQGMARISIAWRQAFTVCVDGEGLVGACLGGSSHEDAQPFEVHPGTQVEVNHTASRLTDIGIRIEVVNGFPPQAQVIAQLIDADTGGVVATARADEETPEVTFTGVTPGRYVVKLSCTLLPTSYLGASGVGASVESVEPIEVTGDGAPLSFEALLVRTLVDSSSTIHVDAGPLAFGTPASVTVTVTTLGEVDQDEVDYELHVDGALVAQGSALLNAPTTLATPVMEVGTHTIDFVAKDTGNVRGSRASASIEVVKATPTVTLRVDSPSTVIGSQIRAHVEAFAGNTRIVGLPITVTLGEQSRQVVLNNWLTPVLFDSPSTAGTFTMEARLPGGPNWNEGEATAQVTVIKRDVTLSAAFDKGEYAWGEDATLTFDVLAGNFTPEGTVTLLEGEQIIETVQLPASSMTVNTSLIGAGTRNLRLEYSGDARLNAASTNLGLTVAGIETRTQILDAPSSIPRGTAFDVHVQVDFVDPTLVPDQGWVTGTVRVSGGGLSVTGELSDGQVTVRMPGQIGVGEHQLVAEYLGNQENQGSTSTPVVLEVTKAPSSVWVPNLVPGQYGSASTISVQVRSTEGVQPSGVVDVQVDGVTKAQGQVSGGWATVTMPADIPSGGHFLTIVYSGNEEVMASTSSLIAWTVNPGPPSITAEVDRDLVPLTPGEADARVMLSASILAEEGIPVVYRVWWGDGTVTDPTSYTGPFTLVHDYSAAGEYRIRVQADASHDGHTLVKTYALKVQVYEDTPLSAVAGEDQRVVAGDPVWFDATASTPAAAIDSVEWAFSDGGSASGWQVSHVFTEVGEHWARLTVYKGAESASATVAVTVVPISLSGGVEVTVSSAEGLLDGAQVVYVAPDGARISGVTDARGLAVLHGLPDGEHVLSVWADGFTPATVNVTVTGGAGRAQIDMVKGEVASAVLDHHQMSLEEILEAGIDVNAVENQHVYHASIGLQFSAGAPQQVFTVIYGVDAGGAAPGIYSVTCEGDCVWPTGPGTGGMNVEPSIKIVNGQPVIQWLVVPVRAAWLKEMFEVKLVVTSLAPAGSDFTFTDGSATLSLPSGLSLASMVGAPQELTKPVPDVHGGGSAWVSWYVRGDEAGTYTDVSATYNATVAPVDVPVALEAKVSVPVKVWGADALRMAIQVDGKVRNWTPYRVKVVVENTTSGLQAVSVNNVSFGLLEDMVDGTVRYQLVPHQDSATEVAVLEPGRSVEALYTLIPDFKEGTVTQEAFALDLTKSAVVQTGGTVDLGATLEELPEAQVYDAESQLLTSGGSPSNQVLALDWEAVPGAVNYHVYSRDALGDPKVASWRLLATTTDSAVHLDEARAGLGRYVLVLTEFADPAAPFLAVHPMTSTAPGYVALGDGLSSGEGLPPFEEGTDTDREAWAGAVGDGGGAGLSQVLGHLTSGSANTCHRSEDGAFPSQVFTQDELDPLAGVEARTCSGALVADLTEANPAQSLPGTPGTLVGAQAEALSAFTDVVTVTAGAADAGLGDLGVTCAPGDTACQEAMEHITAGSLNTYLQLQTNAARAAGMALTSPDGVACEDPLSCALALREAADLADGSHAGAGREASFAALMDGAVQARLTQGYVALMDAAPNAVIYVGTYPRLFNEETLGSGLGATASCPVGAGSLNQAQRVALNGVVDELNNAIRSAAAQANATRADGGSVQVVDVEPYFAGRWLCVDGMPNANSALHPMNPGVSWAQAYDEATFGFHPNAAGQALYAQAFRQAVSAGRTGDMAFSLEGTVERGFDVAAGTRLLRVQAQAVGARPFDLALIAPDGTVVDAASEGAWAGEVGGYRVLRLDNPAPGTWRIRTSATAGAPIDEGSASTLVNAVMLPHAVAVPVASGVLETTADGYAFDASASRNAVSYLWVFADGTTATDARVERTFAPGEEVAATVMVTSATGLRSFAQVRLDEVGAPLVSVIAPRIHGTPLPGETLQVDKGQWYPEAEEIQVQWLRDGEPIKGATGVDHEVTADDVGHRLSVLVTARRTGNADGLVTTAEVSVDNHPVLITGISHPATAIHGETVTVSATVERDGSPVGVGQAELVAGELVLTSATPLEDGTVTFTLDTLAVGTHSLRIRVSTEGQESWSEPFEITVVEASSQVSAQVEEPVQLLGSAVPVTVAVRSAGVRVGDEVALVLLTDEGAGPGTGAGAQERTVATWTIAAEDMDEGGATLVRSFDAAELGLGSHSLLVRYAGNAGTEESESPSFTVLVMQPTEVTATVEVVPANTPRVVDVQVSAEAVEGFPLTGEVVLDAHGWASPVSAELVAGRASVELPGREVGTETIHITYTGDGPYAASTTTVDSVTRAATSRVTLELLPSWATWGDLVTAQAVVTTETGAAPSGAVTLYMAGADGMPTGEALCAQTVEAGQASCTFQPDTTGEVPHVAVFTSDTVAVESSHSAPATLTVTGRTPELTVLVPATTVTTGDVVTGTVLVDALGVPQGGSVSVTLGSQTVDAVPGGSPEQGWTFTLPTTGVLPGEHVITVSFTPEATVILPVAETFTLTVTAKASALAAELDPAQVLAGGEPAKVRVTHPDAPSTPVTIAWGESESDHAVVELDDAGEAEYTLPVLPVGEHTITVTHQGTEWVGIGSVELNLQVHARPGVVAASAEDSVFGLEAPMVVISFVDLDEGEAPDPAGGTAATPTGTVTLSAEGMEDVTASLDALPLSVPLGQLPVGVHEVGVAYSGDPNFAPSEAAVTVTVLPTPTIVSVTWPDTLSLGATGVAVPYEVGVDGEAGEDLVLPALIGTVELLVDDAVVASGTGPSGELLLPANLTEGVHNLQVRYLGTQDSAPTSHNSQVIVAGRPTTLKVTGPAQVTIGARITLRVQATSPGGQVTGSVTLVNGEQVLDAAPLVGSRAQFKISSLLTGAGTHDLRVVYEGAEGFAPASATHTVVVNKVRSTLSARVMRSPDAEHVATIRATVKSNPVQATGVVTASDGQGSQLEAAIENGVAVLYVPRTVPDGIHVYTVEYAGDDQVGAAKPVTVRVQVNTRGSSPSPTGRPVVVSAAGPLVAGSTSTVTATGLEPREAVTFRAREGETLLGTTVADASGRAVLTFEVPGHLPAGEQFIEVVGMHGVAATRVAVATAVEEGDLMTDGFGGSSSGAVRAEGARGDHSGAPGLPPAVALTVAGAVFAAALASACAPTRRLRLRRARGQHR